MDSNHEPKSRHPAIRVVDNLATVAGVGRRVLLFCSPTAAVVLFAQGFGEQHYRMLALVLVAFVVFVSAWTIVARPADDGTVEMVLTAWFYNMVAFGATVLAVQYARSPVRFLFLVGFPLVVVEFRRHLVDGANGGN